MKNDHLKKRKCKKNKEITWGRKVCLDGSVKYKFVSGGLFWVVTIAKGTVNNRPNIAKMLISHRKKFLHWIEYGVVKIGGKN